MHDPAGTWYKSALRHNPQRQTFAKYEKLFCDRMVYKCTSVTKLVAIRLTQTFGMQKEAIVQKCQSG